MLRPTILAALAVTALAAVPAPAATNRTDALAGLVRDTRTVCRADLRGSSCAGQQQRLLLAIGADAHASDKAISLHEVGHRQLDGLLASIR